MKLMRQLGEKIENSIDNQLFIPVRGLVHSSCNYSVLLDRIRGYELNTDALVVSINTKSFKDSHETT